MSMSTETLDEIPLREYDELRAMKKHALTAIACCIALFIITCSLAFNVWQMIRNEEALTRENGLLRLRLSAEQHVRRTLEAARPPSLEPKLEAKP